MTPHGDRSELRANLPLLVAAATSVGFGMSGMSVFMLGVFAGPVTADLGWPLSFFQLAATLLLPATLIAGPVVGWLVDRHGARAVAVPSLIAFGITLACVGQVTAAHWTWITVWLVMGFGGAGTTALAWAPAISGAFVRNRGLALAIMLSGSSVTATFGPSLARALIDGVGWRTAYAVLGSLSLLVAAPLALLLVRPGRTAPRAAAAGAATGATVGEALRDRRFWLMAVAFTLVMLGISGMITNLVPILVRAGWQPAAAAGVSGVLGVALLGGRLTTGFLVDRLSPKLVGVVALSLPAFSLPLLVLGDSVAAAALGIALIGIASGAEFDLIAFLCARLFGTRQFGRIYSLIVIPLSITTSIGGPLLALSADRTGSFAAAIIWVSPVILAGAWLLLFLRIPPKAPIA